MTTDALEVLAGLHVVVGVLTFAARRVFWRHSYRATCPTKHVWVTRDGRRIPIRKMEDSHLINTIDFLYRRWELVGLSPAEIAAELSRGQVAWDGLVAEAKRRKLSSVALVAIRGSRAVHARSTSC